MSSGLIIQPLGLIKTQKLALNSKGEIVVSKNPKICKRCKTVNSARNKKCLICKTKLK